MAFKSLADTMRLLVVTPYVWISGVFACLAILLTYMVYLQFGLIFAVPIAVVCIFLIPAFLAGTYGVILENRGSPSVYFKYIRMGYFKCLFPTIFVIALAFIGTGAISYVLINLGFEMGIYVYVIMFVALPLLFFFYFSDMTALIGAGSLLKSLRESALRVMMGSFAITMFYLINILVFFIMDFVFSTVVSVFALESMNFMGSMSNADVISMDQDQLVNYVDTILDSFLSSEAVQTALVVALSVCSFVFIPFYSTYKACFFKGMITTVPPVIKKIQEDGEYDEKGRWFKYK